MTEREVVYLPAFRRDFRDILIWSTKHFGRSAAERYSALVRQALRDLAEDPVRPGANLRRDLVNGGRVYHLTFSRGRVSGDTVTTPRHFILYRYDPDRIEFARLLHDSLDIGRHLPGSYRS